MKSQNCREDYNRKLYEVLQSVGGVEDQKDYLMKLAKYQAAVRAFRKDKNKVHRVHIPHQCRIVHGGYVIFEVVIWTRIMLSCVGYLVIWILFKVKMTSK